ncbi:MULTISPECIES: hypothetical protein [Brenneria]|uniref:Uncharacterized protein n=1 Tax=Brenneria nigrifluens DSM 30175 = ATCC 13028 TaxID=1121120 RepID=A0A2U1UK47_9GAMM|nr:MULTISPECIES: hypothetical protein [Brenneria]EHD20375.1 hypothetical protein BrE312_0935 [Brenneria sp. EniD312]PWC22055.1 hypothetical protein DDT54_17565 [Brenneria nigrifluens DSM 30175 = ATCC 13028]QCR03581.1 hypothetical protein EH206_04785 [Brenneria nigrifluens DSM 30175 = ATCC 13028]
MTEFYVLVQEQLTVISTMLIIGLAALFCAELKSNFQQLWKKPEALQGRIVHRCYLPAQRTLTLIDNFYGYVPVHALESERFILDVEAGGQRYQVEADEETYRTLFVGDSVVIYANRDDITIAPSCAKTL